jgi:integrase
LWYSVKPFTRKQNQRFIHGMENHDATLVNCESGKGLPKCSSESNLLTPSTANAKVIGKQSSKFSAQVWAAKVYRARYLRDGKWTEVSEWRVRIQHARRREDIGLGTNFREEAGRKAARFYQDIRTHGWDEALRKFRPDSGPRSLVTVGGYIETVSPLLKVRQRSLANYIYALRRIANDATGPRDTSKARFNPSANAWRDRADKVRLDALKPEVVEAWKAAFILEAGDSPVERQRARRSVNSYVRNARALFSRRVVKRLKKLRLPLPSPLPFEGVEMERQGSTHYVSTINAGKLMRKARETLANDDPEAWKIFLIALGAGLRRSEIDGLRWEQIDWRRRQIRVTNTESFEAKTEDSEGAVDVDASLLSRLKPLMKTARGPFVVEPETVQPKRAGQFYRCAETFARVTTWLRANGVQGDRPLHQLRKEFGSLINETSGIHAASRALRHSDIRTTSQYYADARRRAVVNLGELLIPKKSRP